MDEIVSYKPTRPSDSWDSIFERVRAHPDDGHAAKLVRALAHGEKICQEYEDDARFRIKGAMWLQLGHMGNYFEYYKHEELADRGSSNRFRRGHD